MAEKNKRLKQGEDIIYPFTKQENIIGLQGTIKEKLPIVSENEPVSGFVERQVLIQVEETVPDGEPVAELNAQPRQAIENNYEQSGNQPNYSNENIENNYEGEN